MKLKLTIFSAITTLFCSALYAQENITFQQPSASILQLADYQRPPTVLSNSKNTVFIFAYRPTYKSLADLNIEEVRLAGLRINPKTNISSSMSYLNSIKLFSVKEAREREISGLPQNAKIAYLKFSPDERFLAFTNTTDSGVELWIVDLEKVMAKKLTSAVLNANLGAPYDWAKDSKSLLIKKIPDHRPDLIQTTQSLPVGPTVSNSDGQVSQNRTYPDLLKNPQDEQNFEILMQSELCKVDLEGHVRNFKKAAMYSDVSISPNGEYVLLSTIEKPFSYIVPLGRFPFLTQVFTFDGELVKEVNRTPLVEVMPKGFSATKIGKRNMSWRSDVPASLVYVAALDGGDPSKEVPFRDEIFLWKAPFNEEPSSIFKTKLRFSNISWTTNSMYCIVSETWYDTRKVKSFVLNLNTSKSELIEDRNYQDVYQDPGSFNQVNNQYANKVIDVQKDHVYLLGEGFSAKGQHPFIDELNLKTLQKKRLYTSKSDHSLEQLLEITDLKKGEVLVRVQ